MTRGDNWRFGQHRIRRDLKGDQTGFFDTKYGGMPAATVGLEYFTKAAYVVAPEGGCPPAITHSRPSYTECQILIRAPENRIWEGIEAGDLVLSGETCRVANFWNSYAGQKGSRKVQVDNHSDDAQVIGWDCHDEGNPDNWTFWDPTPDPPPNCPYYPNGEVNPNYNPLLPDAPNCANWNCSTLPNGDPNPGYNQSNPSDWRCAYNLVSPEPTDP
jgi:hypothetical protein